MATLPTYETELIYGEVSHQSAQNTKFHLILNGVHFERGLGWRVCMIVWLIKSLSKKITL